MKKAIIEVDRSQLLNALGRLPQNDLKRIVDTLFLKRLFKQPDFEEVSAKTRRIIRKKALKPEVVEEAIQWARKQK